MKSNKTRESISFHTTSRITSGSSRFGLKKFGEGKFRSKYENAFAVYLNGLGIKWEFEPYGAEILDPSGTKLHYIPDFYLPEYKIYVEIANGVSKRLCRKMYLFTSQHESKKLIVFDVQHLRDMFDSKFNLYDVIGYPKKKTS